jgi:hypothetical protein
MINYECSDGARVPVTDSHSKTAKLYITAYTGGTAMGEYTDGELGGRQVRWLETDARVTEDLDILVEDATGKELTVGRATPPDSTSLKGCGLFGRKVGDPQPVAVQVQAVTQPQVAILEIGTQNYCGTLDDYSPYIGRGLDVYAFYGETPTTVKLAGGGVFEAKLLRFYDADYRCNAAQDLIFTVPRSARAGLDPDWRTAP